MRQLYILGYLGAGLFRLSVNNSYPAKVLLWIAAFILTVLFAYSVVAFAFFYRSFETNDSEGKFCASLLECLVTVIRFGLQDQLGLVS